MKPPIFLDLQVPDALARAREERRLLLVAVSSTKHPASSNLDQFTWTHPGVVARLRELAIAIQVDGDGQPETVTRLKVKAMPTTLVFRDGAEVDRVVGFLQAEKVLEWLDAVDRGETHVQQLRREADANPGELHRRMDLGAALLNAQSYDDATTEHLRLWKELPSTDGIKQSVLVDHIRLLVSGHPPAREAFAALRDASVPDLEAPDAQKLTDWCSLNRALGETSKTLAWFDAHHGSALAAPALASALEAIFEPLFVEAERWADLGRLYRDPVEKFRERAERHTAAVAEVRALTASGPPAPPAEMMETMLRSMRETLREAARKLTRALRAAGRDDEAKQIADAALAADDSPEMRAAL